MNTIRIGITMRVTEANGYSEKRDSLAMDWSKYLLSTFPDTQWMYIPNIENSVIEYVTKWGINSFVLTGGDNIAATPERDLTEFALYKFAMQNDYPILGICRGLQIIYHVLGGKIISQDKEFTDLHRARNHKIMFDGQSRIVNSYHENKLEEATLPKELKILARCQEDNSIEAVKGKNLLGIMWHPERDPIIQDWNTEIIKNFFYKKENNKNSL